MRNCLKNIYILTPTATQKYNSTRTHVIDILVLFQPRKCNFKFEKKITEIRVGVYAIERSVIRNNFNPSFLT